MQIANQNIPTYRSQTLRLFFARNWTMSLKYTMISKRKIHNFHGELRPENSIGLTLPWWSPVRDYVSELRSHVLFWGSHEASVRKLTNWKGWFTSEKLQIQPNWTRLRSVHAQIYLKVFVSFRSQVKLTTDDVYYKHQITAMHRLAHEAYVEKTALVFRKI